MNDLSIQNIAAACGGTYVGDPLLLPREISGVAIDSRKVEKDFLFVPIRGERVDGHRFIPQVMEQGALCTLSDHPLTPEDFPEGIPPYILVTSCPQALKDIARFYRIQLGVKVVGITGSVGKTSTKEMIASILVQKYKVLKTEGNYNNEIGLPLTIFRLTKEHEIAVLEMGIDHFGEMHRLADVARPDFAVITNIGYAHLEQLGSREGILKAKTEMFDHLMPNSPVILNGDDDLLTQIDSVNGEAPYFFEIDPKCQTGSADSAHRIYADSIQSLGLKGTACTLHLPKIHNFPATDIPVHIPIPGIHMVSNAMAGACIGRILGLSEQQIADGIAALPPVAGRNHLIETDFLTIIDDCYNANPASMKASLDTLAFANGRQVAVLGDMFELGKDEASLHYEVGAYAAQKGISLILCVGELSLHTADGAAKQGAKVLHFATKADLLAGLSSLLEKGDTVLVKASNGMKFPEVVEALEQLEL